MNSWNLPDGGNTARSRHKGEDLASHMAGKQQGFKNRSFSGPSRWSRDAKYYRRRDRLVFLEREVAALHRLESRE
jgi:hypothetical protein